MKAPPPYRFFLQNQDPKAKAIISDNINLNFEQLTGIVMSSASLLYEEGILDGDHIGIYNDNSPEYLITLLALWQIGAIPVPLNIRLSKREIVTQIKIAKCQYVLTGDKSDIKIEDPSIVKFCPPMDIKKKPIMQKARFDLNKTAAIIFTSGSGNSPKGVQLSFNNLYQSGFHSNKLLRYSHSDKWLVSLPIYHISGFSILTRAILWGIPLIFPQSSSPGDLAIELQKSQPTFISLVAAQLKALVDKEVIPNHELKNCLLGGGFSDYKLIKNAIALGYPISVVYGSTETSSFITALSTEEFEVKRNSVGRTIPPSNISIYDEQGNELKAYEVGEIVIQSPCLMEGYINKTKEDFKNRIYFSGDIGYLDEEGYLFIVGRKGYIISTGGENVNPQEVETALLNHPNIDEAVVFPLKDKKWGEIVAAVIVKKDQTSELNYDDIKKFLGKNLSNFKIPKKIFIEKELPKTELGKIERKKIIKNYML